MKSIIRFWGIVLSVILILPIIMTGCGKKAVDSKNESGTIGLIYVQSDDNSISNNSSLISMLSGNSNTPIFTIANHDSSDQVLVTETFAVEKNNNSVPVAPVKTLDKNAVAQTANADPLWQECSMETDELGTLHYWLYTPSNPSKSMPLIVYLHSASGKGDNLNLLREIDGFPKYLSDGLLGNVNAYVIIPQLPTSQRGWVNVEVSVVDLIEKTVNELDIDTSNISLTGHSVGGTGTWNIAIANPGMFSRIAPLSGSVRATNESVNSLKNTAVRAFVGSDDTIIDPVMSQRMVEALKKVGSDAEITVFNGADHEAVPSLTYLDQMIELMNWLIGNTGNSGSSGQSGEPDTNDDTNPSGRRNRKTDRNGILVGK
ncbi:MAG: dienelactone hydrolase family protein [Eubacteriales bacterium]|nr:dienelactone hydrolase family protein [Eubacteriales bacterium]